MSTGCEKTKYLTKEEMSRLLDQVKSNGQLRDQAIFNVAYYLGLRASEVSLLTVGDYQPETNEVYIKRVKGSTSGVRRLDQKRKRILLRNLRSRKDANDVNSPLFMSKKQLPISRQMLDVLMKKFSKKAKIPADKHHFHTLRHSIGVHMAEAGADLEEVQYVLGHKSINNTMIYFQFTTNQMEYFYRKIKGRERYFA
jgi:site-specific recombinase XerD